MTQGHQEVRCPQKQMKGIVYTERKERERNNEKKHIWRSKQEAILSENMLLGFLDDTRLRSGITSVHRNLGRVHAREALTGFYYLSG